MVEGGFKEQLLANYCLLAKSGLPLVVVNKMLSELSCITFYATNLVA